VTGQLPLSPVVFWLLAEHRVAVPDGAGATRRASSGWIVGGNKRSADTRHPVRCRPQDGCAGGAGTYDPQDSSKKQKKSFYSPSAARSSLRALESATCLLSACPFIEIRTATLVRQSYCFFGSCRHAVFCATRWAFNVPKYSTGCGFRRPNCDNYGHFEGRLLWIKSALK